MRRHRISLLTYSIHVTGSLLLGTGCYLFFRRDTYINRLFHINGPLSDLSLGQIGSLLRFHLADAAWGYALTIVQTIPMTINEKI